MIFPKGEVLFNCRRSVHHCQLRTMQASSRGTNRELHPINDTREKQILILFQVSVFSTIYLQKQLNLFE